MTKHYELSDEAWTVVADLKVSGIAGAMDVVDPRDQRQSTYAGPTVSEQ